MNSRNICKFIPASSDDSLKAHNFIFESNPETMKTLQESFQHKIILIKEGTGNISIDNSNLSFSAGDIIFIFKNESHLINSSPDCEYMYISFDGARSESLFARFGINRSNRILSGFEGIIPLWHESLLRASEENIDLCSESILLYTFSRLKTVLDDKNNIVSSIISISEEHFTDPELSITAIANELSYNPKYLSHIFKKSTGTSYSEYLRNLRIKYAVSLFDHGIDSIKNVAFLSGFTDQLYFSTVFKKSVGISPAEYRKKTTN